MTNDLAAKVNEVARRQRELSEVIGTDLLSRQSVPDAGFLPVGSDERQIDLLAPEGDDGQVLTLDHTKPLRMKWAPSTGGGIEHVYPDTRPYTTTEVASGSSSSL